MFKTPALAMASFLLLAAPAVAQRGAPITQGTTSLDLADQISQARQLSADTKVQVNALSSDLMTLTGRVETLEFQLQQARNENETLVNDNEALAREINALKSELRAQSRAIQDLQARSLGMDPPEGEAATGLSDYPGAASTDPYESAGATASAPSRPSATGSMSRTATVEPETTGPKRLLPRSESGAPEETAAIDTTPASAVPPGAPQGSLGTLPASALPGEAGPLFAAAKAKLVQFDYAGAEEAFRAFLDQFGSDPQAGEAHYWLAESLYQQKAYAESGAAYTTMIRSYPDDPRAPDALVKLARSMRLIGDKDKACVALDTLPKRYPNASGVTRDLAAVERTRSGCDN
ncbi:tol-pal system protein YbgF [Hyphomonas jannaschiana]|uniref:tol-pal system protein YbgF n=1 Tax=Hyphomonas jannaschiana TaxID=86 RepID=UPI0035C76E23